MFRRLLVAPAAAIAALSLGASTQVATADHYHTNCNDHGLVHGTYTSDNAFHARVTGWSCQETSYCYAGGPQGFLTGNASGPGVTCDAFARGASRGECSAWAYVELDNRFGWHVHYAHSRC